MATWEEIGVRRRQRQVKNWYEKKPRSWAALTHIWDAEVVCPEAATLESLPMKWYGVARTNFILFHLLFQAALFWPYQIALLKRKVTGPFHDFKNSSSFANALQRKWPHDKLLPTSFCQKNSVPKWLQAWFHRYRPYHIRFPFAEFMRTSY